MEPLAVSRSAHRGPRLSFVGLDVLWLQVAGTLCNLACTHCFVRCAPGNESHPMMAQDEVEALLEEAVQLGVKEIYFTGGEPFLHPHIEALIARTLRDFPLSILSNGIPIDPPRAERLAALARASEYSLEIRISLDGGRAAENDPIRGTGSFERILAGARALEAAGMVPVFTITTVDPRYEGLQGRALLLARLRELGFARPRIKTIPPFHIGREAERSFAYATDHLLGEDELLPDAAQTLQCGSSRTVSARGVYPCPILIEEDGARIAERLQDALRPLRLNHAACRTCHVEGFTCRT